MALSSEDKHRVVFALCHPGKILDPDSTHYNSVFNDRLNNLDTFVEDQVLVLLDSIEESKTLLSTSAKKDNVKQIGDIVLDTKVSRSLKTKELNRHRTELSQLLDLPNMCKSGNGGMSCLVL